MDRRLFAITLLLLGGLGALAWPEYQKYAADPARYEQAMGSGVDISQAVIFPPVDEHTDFAYDGSPLLRYLSIERAHVEFDDAAVAAMGDRIATEVGWKMLLATGTQDVRDAELALWERGHQGKAAAITGGALGAPNEEARKVMEWIAGRIEFERVIYGEEALYSRSFNPEVHSGDFFHMDCDQLAHVFMHAAWRLNLDVREVKSPLHTYLVYVGPAQVTGPEITVEATEFRRSFERNGVMDRRGHGIGDGFFIHPDQHRKYGNVRATSALAAASGYFEHATDRDIDDSIVSEVARGLSRLYTLSDTARLDPDAAATRVAQQDEVIAMMEAQAPGTRYPNLASNLWLAHIRAARSALAQGDLDRAQVHADRAISLREEHGVLVIDGEPVGQALVAQVQLARGDRSGARAAFERLYQDVYGGDAGVSARRPSARSHGHAAVLFGLAELGVGRSRIDRFNRFVLPVLNYEERAWPHGDDDRREAAYTLCAQLLRSTDPGFAQKCARRAD